jgi:hypothetical protein
MIRLKRYTAKLCVLDLPLTEQVKELIIKFNITVKGFVEEQRCNKTWITDYEHELHHEVLPTKLQEIKDKKECITQRHQEIEPAR